MNIKSFEVYNFKSIEYSGEIKFPKITILIGANSSGKSSIEQALLLMKQTFEAEEPSIPLVLNGPHVQLGEFGDFIHEKKISKPFAIKFVFEEYEKSAYECEVCQKGYQLKGWFLKHVKEAHPKYWESKQFDIIEEDIAKLYDNWFIETCEPWVIPYIADLIGIKLPYCNEENYEHNKAFVANSIKYFSSIGSYS